MHFGWVTLGQSQIPVAVQIIIIIIIMIIIDILKSAKSVTKLSHALNQGEIIMEKLQYICIPLIRVLTWDVAGSKKPCYPHWSIQTADAFGNLKLRIKWQINKL